MTPPKNQDTQPEGVEERKKKVITLLEEYQTFGSKADENFSPVGYFDDRASWYEFMDNLSALLETEIAAAEERGFHNGYLQGEGTESPEITQAIAAAEQRMVERIREKVKRKHVDPEFKEFVNDILNQLTERKE